MLFNFETEKNLQKKKETKPPRKVFVDLGANCGNTYLKRKEQFDKEGGWEVYLWEPSPQMYTFFLNDLAKQNPDIHILPYAAGIVHKKELPLYIHAGQEDVSDKSQFLDKGKCNPNKVKNPSGATTLYSNAKNAGKPVMVEQLDFPKWLAEQKLRIGVDSFIFKIDIEGAELEIMDVLLSTGTNAKDDDDSSICVAELIEMEFHKRIFKEGSEEYAKHEKFEENFFADFEKKCGRKPNFHSLS